MTAFERHTIYLPVAKLLEMTLGKNCMCPTNSKSSVKARYQSIPVAPAAAAAAAGIVAILTEALSSPQSRYMAIRMASCMSLL